MSSNDKKPRNISVILLETGIVFIIVFILTCMGAPSYTPPRSSMRQKACYSNIRVLAGAIEMYNMDHQDTFKELNEKTLNNLYEEKYIKGDINLPTPRCNYRSEGIIKENGAGFVYCDYHGDIEDKMPDRMDDKFESELRNKAQAQRTLTLITPALIFAAVFFLQAIIL